MGDRCQVVMKQMLICYNSHEQSFQYGVYDFSCTELPEKQRLQATSLVGRGGGKNAPLVLSLPYPCAVLLVLAYKLVSGS